MLIFLHGSDTYRGFLKIQEIKEHYLQANAHGSNLRFFDCAFIQEEIVKGELETQSLFQEKKLFIFKNTCSSKGMSEFFLGKRDFLQATNDLIIFWEEGVVQKRDALYTFLMKHAKVQEYVPLSYISLQQWVVREFGKYNTTIDTYALDVLCKSIGNDLWRMSHEIKKLAAYAYTLKHHIGVLDVKALVKESAESDVFATIDAAASFKKAKALELVFVQMSQGESPFYLLSMIAYKFRKLLEHAASKIPFERLKTSYTKIIQADFAMKTGATTPETAIAFLFSRL